MGKDDDVPNVEYCGISVRIVFIVLAIVGIVLSVLAMGGCEFVEYDPRLPRDSNITDPRDEQIQWIDNAGIGLFKYDPNYEGCRDISDDFDDLTWQFTTAQVCGTVAPALAIIALVLAAVDFLLCRFPCSKPIVTVLFVAACIIQALTMLVYAADICEPVLNNGPYPCSPQSGTWFSAAASVAFLMGFCFACCAPQPLPMCVRVIKNNKSDETDGWCAIFARQKKEGDEEKGEDETEEAEEEEEEEEEVPMTPEEHEAYVEQQQAHALVTTALAGARRGKIEEIEKELALLDQYKEHMPEEEYNERVTALVMAMPNPGTYDAYTKTRDLVVLPEQDEMEGEEEEKVDHEGEEVVLGGDEGVEEGGNEEEEQSKSFFATAASATASAITRPFSSSRKPADASSSEMLFAA